MTFSYLCDGKVTFRWKDYARGSKKRRMTLGAEEYLRRFLLHTLPRGFVRIRSFGFLANRRRATLLPLCQQLLPTNPRPQSPGGGHRPAQRSATPLGVGLPESRS
jgi:hypothetical protein